MPSTMRSKVILGTRSAYQALRPGTSQKLTFTATSGQSSAVGAGTEMVRLFPTQDCWVALGSSPTAAANNGTSVFCPGGVMQYFLIEGSEKVAAIQDTISGDLHIMEGAT